MCRIWVTSMTSSLIAHPTVGHGMSISPFEMLNPAEKPLPNHLNDAEMPRIIAAVFEYDTMTLRLAGYTDYRVTLSNSQDSRHFESHVLTRPHSLDRHGSVPLPRSTYPDKVYLRQPHHLTPIPVSVTLDNDVNTLHKA